MLHLYSACFLIALLLLSLIDRRMDGRKKAATEDNKVDESVAPPVYATIEEDGQQSSYADRKELSGSWHPGVRFKGQGHLSHAWLTQWWKVGRENSRGERLWPKFSDKKRCAISQTAQIDKYLTKFLEIFLWRRKFRSCQQLKKLYWDHKNNTVYSNDFECS